MNRQAAAMAALCTLAVGALSTGVSTFVLAANGAHMDLVRGLGACGSAVLGSWLFYLGHCRMANVAKSKA